MEFYLSDFQASLQKKGEPQDRMEGQSRWKVLGVLGVVCAGIVASMAIHQWARPRGDGRSKSPRCLGDDVFSLFPTGDMEVPSESARSVKGMQAIEGRSFLNATIQCLVGLRAFYSCIYRLKCKPEQRTCRALQQLVRSYDECKNACDPKEFIEKIGLGDAPPHDARKFLVELLTSLENEYEKVGEIFRVKCIQVIECKKCNEYIQIDDLWMVCPAIGMGADDPSIEKGLLGLDTSHKIPMKCSKCHGNDVEVRQQVDGSGACIIFQVNRANEKGEESNDMVRVERRLHMHSGVYRLVGMVCRQYYLKDHFYCHVLRNNTWYIINDEKYREEDGPPERSRNVQVAFYEMEY